MALDETKDSDEVFKFDGYDYIVDKEFLETAKPIKVDFLSTGFFISSSIELGKGCTSCGSGGGCGTP
jgi:Fe-S cluster assembly iron-binding protein IscA